MAGPKQLTIHGSWTMSAIGLGEVARYVAERKLPLKKLITHRFRLEQAAEAYKNFESGQTGKVIFSF
jgi:threonine dehydrogenase-like Zn-dependent dehydrogenase